MPIRPIDPNKVQEAKSALLPDAVVGSFNELIAEKWSAGTQSASFTQDEVIDRILVKMKGVTRHQLFERNLLDVEPKYRAEGWVVEYDKPGYNESYKATFTFIKPAREAGIF